MSLMTADPFEREQARDAVLWTAAALVVAALHVGLALGYLLLRPAPEGRAEAPAIDVAFMPAVSAPAPPPPEAVPAEPTPPVERSDLAPPTNEPVAPQEVVAEPEPPPMKIEPAPPPRSEPAHNDQITVMPPPPAHKPVSNDEKAAREHRKTAPLKPAAAPGSKPARLAMAPNPGADSEGARAGRASWESELAAHIRRYATYAANGSTETGTVRVGVTIDRNGRLLSRRLAGSSGSSTLDSAAMAVIQRAQPFPRFPPGMNQAQIALTIPLHLRPQ